MVIRGRIKGSTNNTSMLEYENGDTNNTPILHYENGDTNNTPMLHYVNGETNKETNKQHDMTEYSKL